METNPTQTPRFGEDFTIQVCSLYSEKSICHIFGELSSAQSCDTCSGLRVSNGYRMILTCQNLFGIKNLPVLFVSCTPECLQNLFTDDTENVPLNSRNSFIVNEKFLAKLKTHHM